MGGKWDLLNVTTDTRTILFFWMGGMHSNLVCVNSFNRGWMRCDGCGNQSGTKTLTFTSKTRICPTVG